MNADSKRPRPVVIPATAPHWEASAAGRLDLPRSADGSWEPYPRPGTGVEYEWATASERGTVHTFSVVHISPYADVATPFVVALVQLDDGPRVTTNIVDADPTSVTIGMRVELTFAELDDHRLPVFRPAS